MTRALLLIALWLLPSAALAESRFELLTFGPGDALWERFGHTALRLRSGNLDLVFSFGHARFTDPSFGYHFLRGEAPFFVVAQPMSEVLERYRGWDRTVETQRLSLPDERVKWLRDQLARTVTPPHNTYIYDQLYDNCSTRVRDLLDEASDGALRRAAERRVTGKTFRDYTLDASRGHWFAHWGLDLIGGPHQDLPVSAWEEMFVPEALKQGTLVAQRVVRGNAERLSGPPRVLYVRTARPALHGDPLGARKVGGLLAALLAALTLSPLLDRQRARPRLLRGAGLALAISGSAMAIAGAMVLFLVLVSRVHDFTWNENVFVFCVLDALLVKDGLAMLRGRRTALSGLTVQYLCARAAVLAAYLLLGPLHVFRQHNGALLTIAAVLVISPLLLALGQRTLTKEGHR